MINAQRFNNEKDCAQAFLDEAWPLRRKEKIDWSEWTTAMINRYREWLFEETDKNCRDYGSVEWTRPRSSSASEETETISPTETVKGKTINPSKTIYWTNPPCQDQDDTNNSIIKKVDKNVAKSIKDWANGKWATGEEDYKPRTNKERFDSFNDAWNCFMSEMNVPPACSQQDKLEWFCDWLFQPYRPFKLIVSHSGGNGSVDVVKNTENNQQVKWRMFQAEGYSEDLAEENRKLRKFIREMLEDEETPPSFDENEKRGL